MRNHKQSEKENHWENLWEPHINPKFIKNLYWEFPGSPVVKTSPSSTGE